MPDPLAWLADALAELDRHSLRRTLSVRAGPQRADLIEFGEDSSRLAPRDAGLTRSVRTTLVNFGSNDYLGLASDGRVIAAAKAAAEEFGFGSGASPLVTGRSPLHAELERRLAEFEETEAALLFPTGYAANVGTIAALVGKGDAVYSDELNHASIIDGCRLSGAAIHVYRHRDVEHLGELLSRPAPPHPRPSNIRRRLIVTESLFSMHGDYAPLSGLAWLAKDHNAMLLVDEAHATGVFGEHGRGLCEEDGVEREVAVRVGTLSKALGSHGGFVTGSSRLIEWLVNRARPYIFSTAAPASVVAAGLAAIQICQSEPRRRARAQKLALHLREQLVLKGLIQPTSLSQIVPVVFGEASRAMAAAADLRRRGFLVPAIRPPSVPEGQSLLRISLTCLHTEQQLDDLIAGLAAVVG